MTAIRGQLLDDETRLELNTYLEWLRKRYIIPGQVSSALEDSMSLLEDFDGGLRNTTFFTPDSLTEDGYVEMVQRFEQDFLGLPPNGSTDGIRWWVSNSGFSGGSYPTESIANIFELSPPGLLDLIRSNKQGCDYVDISADEYLFHVKDTSRGDETVAIDGIRELTKDGRLYVESVLSAYEQGHIDGSASLQIS